MRNPESGIGGGGGREEGCIAQKSTWRRSVNTDQKVL